MKKEITIQPWHFRGHKGGTITFKYYMTYDDHNRREITITGPYNNFDEKNDYQGRMKRIFLTLFRKSGYSHMMENDKILMSYSDFMNFEFKNFPNLTIENVLL